MYKYLITILLFFLSELQQQALVTFSSLRQILQNAREEFSQPSARFNQYFVIYILAIYQSNDLQTFAAVPQKQLNKDKSLRVDHVCVITVSEQSSAPQR